MSSSASSSQSRESSQDTTPFVVTLRTVHSDSSLNDAYSAECILDIPNSKTQGSCSKHPFELDQFQSISNGKKPYNSKNQSSPSSSLTKYTFDQIEHLTTLAKHAALIRSPVALDQIDDLADLTTRLAIDLLEAKVSLQTIAQQYESDTTLVHSTILALRTSRTKLEAERSHIQDLSTRMSGIKFDLMTALAKFRVQKAEYEYRAKEALKDSTIKLRDPKTRDPELLAWNDMEQYMTEYGSRPDDEKNGPEAM
ncbi:hypothetical protein DL98DRAFT_538288 [Cadophora sp. DSE1049]|nr:hypothetical protein DL98DRAFT_538288 [Cadophora sp. DSE1049]